MTDYRYRGGVLFSRENDWEQWVVVDGEAAFEPPPAPEPIPAPDTGLITVATNPPAKGDLSLQIRRIGDVVYVYILWVIAVAGDQNDFAYQFADEYALGTPETLIYSDVTFRTVWSLPGSLGTGVIITPPDAPAQIIPYDEFIFGDGDGATLSALYVYTTNSPFPTPEPE